MGNYIPRKLTETNHRYYWDIGQPGWPGLAFRNHIKAEINRVYPVTEITQLTNLMLSITNQCPLRCDHCYEWDNLNTNEKLSAGQLIKTVDTFQSRGVAQIMLGGGEPMMNFNVLLEILKRSKEGSDFWIVTSGVGFTQERSRILKHAGLTGIYLSLDHYDENKHNSFRHNENSFRLAREAAKNAKGAGVVVGLSLCPIKSFVSEKNLKEYAELAKQWGVSFILLVEPRDVGHYKGKDVLLSHQEHQILEDFFIDFNKDPKYKDYPIISFPAYHQRKTGCHGAGIRYLYVDANGDILTCPFCRQKAGNILDNTLEDSVSKLQKHGCAKYDLSSL